MLKIGKQKSKTGSKPSLRGRHSWTSLASSCRNCRNFTPRKFISALCQKQSSPNPHSLLSQLLQQGCQVHIKNGQNFDCTIVATILTFLTILCGDPVLEPLARGRKYLPFMWVQTSRSGDLGEQPCVPSYSSEWGKFIALILVIYMIYKFPHSRGSRKCTSSHLV